MANRSQSVSPVLVTLTNTMSEITKHLVELKVSQAQSANVSPHMVSLIKDAGDKIIDNVDKANREFLAHSNAYMQIYNTIAENKRVYSEAERELSEIKHAIDNEEKKLKSLQVASTKLKSKLAEFKDQKIVTTRIQPLEEMALALRNELTEVETSLTHCQVWLRDHRRAMQQQKATPILSPLPVEPEPSEYDKNMKLMLFHAEHVDRLQGRHHELQSQIRHCKETLQNLFK